MVIGHWVKASPAKMARPMLSFGRPMMNSAATCLAASIRLGFRSSASIEVETSIASMMSMPSTVLLFHEFCVCGRASTSTIIVKASTLRSIESGINFTFQLLGRWLKAKVSLMRIVGSVFFLYITYQMM